jgi:hypothetical protein
LKLLNQKLHEEEDNEIKQRLIGMISVCPVKRPLETIDGLILRILQERIFDTKEVQRSFKKIRV